MEWFAIKVCARQSVNKIKNIANHFDNISFGIPTCFFSVLQRTGHMRAFVIDCCIMLGMKRKIVETAKQAEECRESIFHCQDHATRFRKKGALGQGRTTKPPGHPDGAPP